MKKNRIYTIAEFAEAFKHSQEYVRQMCRQQKYFKDGHKYNYDLPKEWKCQKVGKTWLIYPADAQVGPEDLFRKLTEPS